MITGMHIRNVTDGENGEKKRQFLKPRRFLPPEQ